MADDTTGRFMRPGHTPHPTDIHVGLRVRMRRKALRLSQDWLATQVGLTFQQVQKYERGSNRISCSKLFEISRALNVAPAWFFDGLALSEGVTEGEDAIADFLRTAQGLALAKALNHITPAQRVAFLQLAESMGASATTGVEA